MNPALRLLGVFFVAGLLCPLAAMERLVEKNFPVEAGAKLKFSTYRGGVIVELSEAPVIRVQVRIDLATEDAAEAERLLKELDLQLTASGNTITVQARNPHESGPQFTWSKPGLDLSFRIFVPRLCDVDLSTTDGTIAVGQTGGNVIARSRTGTISCRQVEGSTQATSDTGEIIVSRCLGSVDLAVTRGTIRAGTIFGAATLRNGRGEIEIQNARGALTASTAGGEIIAGLSRHHRGAVSLHADGGSIHLNLDPAIACEVRATAGWGGKIETALPFALLPSGNRKRSFSGKLNGGGSAVTLRASGGNVKIDASNQFID